VVTVDGSPVVTLVDRPHIQSIVRNVLLMLFDLSDEGLMTLNDLHAGYRQHFGQVINIRDFEADLENYIEVRFDKN